MKLFFLLGLFTLSTQAFSQALGPVYMDINAMSDKQLECQVIEDGFLTTSSASSENLLGVTTFGASQEGSLTYKSERNEGGKLSLEITLNGALFKTEGSETNVSSSVKEVTDHYDLNYTVNCTFK